MRTYYQLKREMDMAVGGVAYTPDSKLYVGLSSTKINQDGTGATEPQSTMNYSRVEVDNSNVSWQNTVNCEKKNLILIEFNEATGNWNVQKQIFLADARQGGNILFYDDLPSERLVQENSTVIFKPETITFRGE